MGRQGHQLVTVELDAGETIPDFDGFDLLAVMGGPMDVWQEDAHPWLATEKRAIRTWVETSGRPYFGICLGHQLLADALEPFSVKRKRSAGLDGVGYSFGRRRS